MSRLQAAMGLATFAIALVPTYGTIGAGAAVAFLAALELWLLNDGSRAHSPKSGFVGNGGPKGLPD